MNKVEQQDFLALLKALADEQRLTMLGLMNWQERTVKELAEFLSLSEATVSHHISKLRNAGLLNIRMAGTQHFYMVNDTRLSAFKHYVAQIERPVVERQVTISDEAWIDALEGWSEKDKKVLRDYTFNEKLTQIPAKDAKWIIILRWIASKFEIDVRYTEREINAVILEIHPDYATIRRNMIAYGFMERERGGVYYWRTPEKEPPM